MTLRKHSHLISCKASNRMSRDLFPLFFSVVVAAFVVDDGLSQDLMINKPDCYTQEIFNTIQKNLKSTNLLMLEIYN